MPKPPPAPPLAAAVEPYSQDAQPTGMEMDDSFEPTQVVEDLDPYPVQEQESRIMEVEPGQDLASQASNTQGPEATDLENEEEQSWPSPVQPTHAADVEQKPSPDKELQQAHAEIEEIEQQPPSEATVKQRLRRVFARRADGSYQVADEFVKLYADKGPGGGREKLFRMFEKAAFVPDAWFHVALYFQEITVTVYHTLALVCPSYNVTAQERFVKRCRHLTSTINEEVMEIEGEFMTIEDMQARKFSPCLAPHTYRSLSSSIV